MKVSHLLTRVESMNNVHSLVRSIITYAVCIPLAAVLGYMLTKPLSFSEAAIYCILLFILIFPLLNRFHYPLMLVCWNMPINMFFIKTSPSIGMVMMPISLGVSIFNRILARRVRFLGVPEMVLPLTVMLVVVGFTAELTGGFGLRSLGGDVYGGKKYAYLIVGILGFFALTARAIPEERAGFYLSLYLLGPALGVISDTAAFAPSGLSFIYLFIPPSGAGFGKLLLDPNSFTRWSGVGGFGLTMFTWMLGRFGVRGVLLSRHVWRPLFFFVFFCLIGLGGFRSAIMQSLLLFAMLFFMERLHKTPLMFGLLLGGAVLFSVALPFASHLPVPVQRSLAFLPLDLAPEAVQSAEGSSEWRLDLWSSMLQQVPQYFFLGKGYAISMEDWSNIQAASATAGTDTGADNPLAISADYHNGPISVILPFGIWGMLAFVWIIISCIWVLSRNYRYTSQSLQPFNAFLLAYFIVKLVIFLTVFGALQDDLGTFLSVVGFSVALNHGVKSSVAPTSLQGAPLRRAGDGMLRPRPAMARQFINA